MKTETRHIRLNGYRTTVALEMPFWWQLEAKAKSIGISWQEWAKQHLKTMPTGCNRASWLRVSVLLG